MQNTTPGLHSAPVLTTPDTGKPPNQQHEVLHPTTATCQHTPHVQGCMHTLQDATLQARSESLSCFVSAVNHRHSESAAAALQATAGSPLMRRVRTSVSSLLSAVLHSLSTSLPPLQDTTWKHMTAHSQALSPHASEKHTACCHKMSCYHQTAYGSVQPDSTRHGVVCPA